MIDIDPIYWALGIYGVLSITGAGLSAASSPVLRAMGRAMQALALDLGKLRGRP